MKTLNPNDFVHVIEQPASFGIGRPIKIGLGVDGLFTVFDEHDAWLFGPIVFGEVPNGHPPIKPEYMRISLAKYEEDREGHWRRDLLHMATWFQGQKLREPYADVYLYGPSLAPLADRIGAKDIDTVKALGLWGKPVELVNEVRGFGVMLPKGTVGAVGVGDYAYAMSGAFSYDVEIPITGLEPHGIGKTLGIRYENLRLKMS
jgi:hypothetical protein